LHAIFLAHAVEVNFLEVIVSLDIDLTDGFQIGNITVVPYNRCEFTVDAAFEVEGYFCQNGNEPTEIDLPVLNQGEIVKICVRPVQEALDLSVRMRNIRNFTFTGADGLSQVAVNNVSPAANGFYLYWCPWTFPGRREQFFTRRQWTYPIMVRPGLRHLSF
jgi:hypothetical protein